MWPFEFRATPASSPKLRSAGSLKRFGTESNGISGTACCAPRVVAHKAINSPKRMRFIGSLLFLDVRLKPDATVPDVPLVASGFSLTALVRCTDAQARNEVRVFVLPRELQRGLPFLRLHVRPRARFEQHVDHRGAAEVDRRRIQQRP